MSQDIHAKLDRLILLVEHTNRLVLAEGRVIMDLTTVIADLDAATNQAAAEQSKLVAEIAALKSQGLPPTDAQLAQLEAIAARVKSLGADPANPVPPVPAPAPAVTP